MSQQQIHRVLSECFYLDVICCLAAKSCLTLCDPMDCSPPGSSVHGISQARILGWVDSSFSRGSFWLKDRAYVSCIGRWLLYHTEPPRKPLDMTQVSSVQSLSRVQLFATPWTAARQASLSITDSQRLLKLMSIESAIPSNHLILCHTLLHPPSIFPSIMVFSNESALHIRWPKYWTFSFSISPSNDYSGLINSLVFSFPYSPTVTSIHDHWKNHSLD